MLIVFLAALGSAIGAVHFPMFKQCDPAWDNIPMGVNGPGERSTICGEGCKSLFQPHATLTCCFTTVPPRAGAMTSVSMALNGLGVMINGTTAVNPATLNLWLEANNGYECLSGDCNNLVLDVINVVSGGRLSFISEEEKEPFEDIAAGLTSLSTIYVGQSRARGRLFVCLVLVLFVCRFNVHPVCANVCWYVYV